MLGCWEKYIELNIASVPTSSSSSSFLLSSFFFLAYNVCKIRIGQSQTKHSHYSLLKSQNHLIKVYIALAHFRFLVQYVYLYNMHTCTTHICLLYKGILCTIYTKK